MNVAFMYSCFILFKKKVRKGVWWMPRLTEAMKDVISCDKLRVGANKPLIRRISEWGQPGRLKDGHSR